MESVQPRECLRGMRAHLELLQGHVGDKLARQGGAKVRDSRDKALDEVTALVRLCVPTILLCPWL